MSKNAVTRDQIVALQTLYAQWLSHSLEIGTDPRAARLAWASESIGRSIASFSELSCNEARGLIDGLKGSLGQVPAGKPRPWRRIRSRERAHAAGTAGRRGADSSFVQMASADDQARIDEALRRLGWSSERYEAWLQSSSSPVLGKSGSAILTVGEANKVWWALKAMLRRSGRWYSKASVHSDAISGGVAHSADF
jgi:hypothetical protein